jgi:ElaB/YqjD/DUF883 family membrane-anchored ribosome-binding protein
VRRIIKVAGDGARVGDVLPGTASPDDKAASLGFLKWLFSRKHPHGATMNSETATFPNTTTTTATNADGKVHKIAQRAHETVDRLEQRVSTGGERLTEWQAEYGDAAREQVRANPIAAVGIAFAAGIVFGKLFMR